MQVHNQMPAKKKEIAETSFKLLHEIRGYVSAGEFHSLLALILCFSDNGMMDAHCRYVPDPSNKNCYFYSEIWNALAPFWEKFISRAGEEKVRFIVDTIRSQKLTPADKLHMLDSYNFSLAKSDVFHTQPQSITQLGFSLLNYQGGTVYNPFAGAASYGLSLKIGDKYYGEEYSPEAWAIGAIKLLLAKSPSRNYIVGNTFKRIGTDDNGPGNMVDGYGDNRFNYVISTPPFGMRIPDNKSMVAEDILLSKTEQLLSPIGTMVMFGLASITTKGGKVQEIRRRLTEYNLIDTVIALPKDAFNPITSIATVAIILKRDRDNIPVKFLDARDCLENKVLKVSEILERLKDPNSFREVSIEQIRDNDYTWHPAKYEDTFIGAPDEGYERIRLKDILIQTGRTSFANGKQRFISVSDLTSDPFNFRKGIENIEEKSNLSSRSAEATARLREESLLSIRNLEEEKEILQIHIADDQEDAKTVESRIPLIRENLSEPVLKEILKLEDEFARLNNRLSDIEEIYQREIEANSEGIDHDNDFIKSLLYKKERIQSQLISLESEINFKKDNLEIEIEMHIQSDEDELKRAKDAIANSQHRLREIDEQIVTIQKRLDHDIKDLEEQASLDFIQVSHPALLLGGKKPKIRFTYIEDTSLDTPVYLSNKTVSAFRVDTSRIDIDYLVYILSTLEVKDFGEMVPMISASDILDLPIDILSSIEVQRAFIEEVRATSNPYYKEMERIKAQYLSLIETERSKHKESEEKLLASLGSKQHDLGNLCPKITLKFADLYDTVEGLPNSVLEKSSILKQIEIIAAEMKDMNNVIAIISDREDFPSATRVDIIRFFNEYIESHPGNDYYIEPLHYDKTELDALGENLYVQASDIALTRAILNIRENAEMHGFNPDTRGINHFFSVSLHVDFDSDTCVIDFSNNGIPMPGGMDEKRYGTKGEKAGDTAHTGNGGWYVSELAKFYGGSFHINPKDADSDLVTIRLILPLSHE